MCVTTTRKLDFVCWTQFAEPLWSFVAPLWCNVMVLFLLNLKDVLQILRKHLSFLPLPVTQFSPAVCEQSSRSLALPKVLAVSNSWNNPQEPANLKPNKRKRKGHPPRVFALLPPLVPGILPTPPQRRLEKQLCEPSKRMQKGHVKCLAVTLICSSIS